MANKTDNLKLMLPLGSDRPDINVLNQNFERIDSAYGQEREERISADVDLAAAIKMESDRATSRENAIESDLNDEITRAQGAEKTLADNLDSEIFRAKLAEEKNADDISNESARATEKENEIETNLSNEVTRATGAESTLTTNLNAEITRAKNAENTNADAISAETTRATAKENKIDSNLSSEITRAKAAESELNAAVNNEISRATQAEQDNAAEIASEIARATQKESALESSLNGEISRAKDEEKSNADSLAAHSSNQSNPHAVTKEQVGLGNVPNVTTNDQTPSYTEASTLSALTNGEKLSIAFGKIAKAVSSLMSHLANTSNPHKVTKSHVGLGNVDNTSDTNKPVSTAQQSAIDLAYANSNAYTDKKISDLINGAPTTLDTLGEIATAMEKHEDVVSAINEAIGTKANQSELDTHTGNNTIHITSSERTSWNDSNTKKHTHGNKSIIDGITQALIDNWNAAYTHISDTVKHITATERINWNAAKTHADSAHAPSNAQANVIETVKVNGTALTPSSKSVNIPVPTKTSEITNDSGYITSKDIDTSQNHTHSNKSILDKITQAMLDKLDGIAFGATKVIVDSALSSSSTNPVQNKVINVALNSKANTSHGTHVEYSSDAPKANGVASAGSASTVARTDHVHPLQASVTGNSGTTTKWATARNINGMSVQGDADRVNYGTCSTAAATTAKTVVCTGFALVTGAEVTVKFTVTNTASSPTLNVNGTGAKPIYYRGAAISAGYLAANRTYTFRYNGTQYELVGDINTNTTYPVVSTSANGLCPKRSGTTTKFLRDDGTWAVPPDTTYGIGNTSTAGITKLYTGTGASVDGTMTQKAITNAINAMVEVGSDITV